MSRSRSNRNRQKERNSPTKDFAGFTQDENGKWVRVKDQVLQQQQGQQVLQGHQGSVVKKAVQGIRSKIKQVVSSPTTGGYQLCDHWREKVKVGKFTVLASGYRAGSKTKDKMLLPPVPDAGVYLYADWAKKLSSFMGCGMATPTKGPWPFIVAAWPDMGVMSAEDEKKLVDTTEKLVRQGKTVEIACMGGHGRTGTLLAMLKVRLGGMGANAAIKAVREEYCEKTVESVSQIEAVYDVAGEERPEKPEIQPSKNYSTSYSYGGLGSTEYKDSDYKVLYCARCKHTENMHRKIIPADKDKGCNALTKGYGSPTCTCPTYVKPKEPKEEGEGKKESKEGEKDGTRRWEDIQRDRCDCSHARHQHYFEAFQGDPVVADDGNDFCVICECDNFTLKTKVTTVVPSGPV